MLEESRTKILAKIPESVVSTGLSGTDSGEAGNTLGSVNLHAKIWSFIVGHVCIVKTTK